MTQRKSKLGWNLVPNIKAKKYSQGTLFSGGTEQRTPESRQPRKYSPERMRAVTEHIGDSGVIEGQANYAKLRQNIARSTAPITDIPSYVNHPISGEPQTRIKINSPRGGIPASGDYSLATGNIRVRPGWESTPTVIHEIGHHSRVISGQFTGMSSFYKLGIEEAAADDYSVRHFRDRRGNSVKPGEIGTYPSRGSHEFAVSYKAARKEGLAKSPVLGPPFKRNLEGVQEELWRKFAHTTPEGGTGYHLGRAYNA